MAKNITGNNQYLKEFNQAVVLDLIRHHKRLSRKELSVLTGLPTACGSITRTLIKDGFYMRRTRRVNWWKKACDA